MPPCRAHHRNRPPSYHRLYRKWKNQTGYKKADALYGEALWYAGQISEEIDDINLWTLDSKYYEACVRFQPHTSLARQCFARFKDHANRHSANDNGGFGTVLSTRVIELEKLAK